MFNGWEVSLSSLNFLFISAQKFMYSWNIAKGLKVVKVKSEWKPKKIAKDEIKDHDSGSLSNHLTLKNLVGIWNPLIVPVPNNLTANETSPIRNGDINYLSKESKRIICLWLWLVVIIKSFENVWYLWES